MTETDEKHDCKLRPEAYAGIDKIIDALDRGSGENRTPVLAGFLCFWGECKDHADAGITQFRTMMRDDLQPHDVAEIREWVGKFIAELNEKYPPT